LSYYKNIGATKMGTVSILPAISLGTGFIPPLHLPEGKDEYYLRNTQIPWAIDRWRHLNPGEIEKLIENNNFSENWDSIFVTNNFDPGQVKHNKFYGLIRLGNISNKILEYHDLKLPVGITNSVIISCDIGDDTAIHEVKYLSHYIIGDRCILSNIKEMNTTNHAKFGNGIIKDGEPEDVRVHLDLMNEAGSRSVIPFDGMISADAWLWAKYRDDTILQDKLKKITQNSFDSRLGYYGTVGDESVIKNSLILKDVKIYSNCYIKGTNKLKNLTIKSSELEPTQIGEGVELVNGIIGYGCHIFYGCKAVRFILGDNSNLKYGARLINSFLGDNSTISCCEVLNNLIFPAHEQHHNNSFLIASVVMGQSNIAAGATIGSNHNSRANDNEIQAGRGFWPGLCTSVKHSCRFASFTLLSKADYPAELDIPLPFSLINNNPAKDQLEILPAFWWMYNMYALARNTWKYNDRDKRMRKFQNIEFDFLAPDTTEEIIHACRLLEIYTAKAYLQREGNPNEIEDENKLVEKGRRLLAGDEEQIKALEIYGVDIEKSKRKIVILKTYKAYHAYHDMLHYYAVKNLLIFMDTNSKSTFSTMSEVLQGKREHNWVNFGGQLISEKDVDKLRLDIRSGNLSSWEEIHNRYNSLYEEYTGEKQKHAYALLCSLSGTDKLTEKLWISAMDKAVVIQEFISKQVYITRKKDFDNPFRIKTFRNPEEMRASIGTIEDNSFVKKIGKETDDFKELVNKIKDR
jgi:hypothetical protein